MKYTSILCFLAISYAISAQSKINLLSSVREKVGIQSYRTPQKQLDITKVQNAKRKATAIWSEDFSNGFNGEGTNGQWTQNGKANSTTGITPKWEFRGPNTNPDNTLGSRGSCGGGTPITSNTTHNGFVIFDSNYWDEPKPDSCAGLGTGLSPRPHYVTLTSPSIDLSTEPEVELFFTTYSRNFQAQVNLFAIVDGDTNLIIELYDYLNLKSNSQTIPDQLLRIDISDIVGLKSDVKLMWEFVGDYYYFSMDDLYLTTIPDYDYEIVNVWNDDITNNFEYYDLPLSQSHLMAPGMQVMSRGKQLVDLELIIRIEDPQGVVFGPYSQILPNFTKDSVSAPIFIPAFKPTEYGEHTIFYQVKSEFDSLNIEEKNTTASKTFNISFDQWSDAYSKSLNSFNAPEIDGIPVEVEAIQLFHSYSSTYLDGIRYAILNSASHPDKSTLVNDEIELSLYSVDKDAYKFALENGLTLKKSKLFTLIHSGTVNVEEEMISTSSGIVVNYYYFGSPINLYNDQLIAISIYNSGGGYLRPVVSSPSINSDGSGLIRSKGMLEDPSSVSDDDMSQQPNINPWLELWMHQWNDISANDILSFQSQAYPNPAYDEVTVSYTLSTPSKVLLALTDLAGKVLIDINEGVQNTGLNQLTFDVSSLDAGVYFYTVSIKGAEISKKLIVTK